MRGVRKKRIDARQTLLDERDVCDLEHLCGLLNSSNEAPSSLTAPQLLELRTLITAWQQSGPNVIAMFDADRALHKKINDSLQKSIFCLPMPTGRAHLIFRSADPNGLPIQLFTELILNSDWRKFGGPCPRCGKYFVRKTAKQSVYCSRRCATQATAIRSTQQRRDEAHKEKLSLANQGYGEWEQQYANGRTKLTWKAWVAQAYPDKITVKFLTRAVNNGEIKLTKPKERKSQ